MRITPNKLLDFPVQIIGIERKGCSTNGNPRFEIIWDDKIGWAGYAMTQSDVSFSYEIGNPGFRVGDWVRLAFTRHGRISDIRKAEAPNL